MCSLLSLLRLKALPAVERVGRHLRRRNQYAVDVSLNHLPLALCLRRWTQNDSNSKLRVYKWVPKPGNIPSHPGPRKQKYAPVRLVLP